MARQKVIAGQVLVLGMHRSGTSAVVKLLERIGCYIGDSNEFLPSNEGNPKGYWERLDVVDLNRRLLETQHKDWVSIADFQLSAVPVEQLRKLQDEAEKIVSRLNERSSWAIKDPRICLLLPFWKPLLARPIYVLCVRDPIEVAKSLRQRNELPLAVGHALWELYAVAMISQTAGSQRLLLHYQKLLDDPVKEARRLSAWLEECGIPGLHTISEGDAHAVVDRQLQRQRIEKEDIQEQIDAAAKLFSTLRLGKIPKAAQLQVSFVSRVILQLHSRARLLSEQLKREVSIYEQNLAAKYDQIEEIERSKTTLERVVAELKTTVQGRDVTVRELHEGHREVEQRIRTLESRVAELKAVLQTRDDVIGELRNREQEAEDRIRGFEARVAELKTTVQGRDVTVRELRGRIRGFEARVAELKTVVQGRDVTVRELHARRKEAEERIRTLEIRVAELNATVETRNRELGEVTSELASRVAVLESINSELAQLRQRAAQFLGPARIGKNRLIAALDKLSDLAERQKLDFG